MLSGPDPDPVGEMPSADALYVACAVGGWLWTQVSPSATFLYGGVFALVGSLALVTLMPGPSSSPRTASA